MRKPPLIPSPYRCLTGLRVSVAALLVLLSLVAIERAACELFGFGSSSCNALQAPYEWWLAAAVVAGMVYTVYAAYRDFFRGRYYSDLAKIQQH
jgi:hypothetical protein